MTTTDTAGNTLPDLTDFLLDWKETCSVDLCRNTPEKQFALRTLDARFCSLALQIRAPDRLKSASDAGRRDSEKAADEETSAPPSDETVPDPDPEKKAEDDEKPSEDAGRPFGETGAKLGRALVEFQLPDDRREEQTIPGEEADKARNRPAPRGEKRSDLRDIAEDIRTGNRRTRAFHLLELRLYDRQTINGKAFKNYLFENIAKNGASTGSVWGYLRSVMRDLVNESFDRNIVAVPPAEGSGDPDSFDSAALSAESVNAARGRAALSADNAEALECLEKTLAREWPRYDLASKTALLFKIFDRPMNDEELFRLAGVGRQALYNRAALARNLLSQLAREGYDQDNFLYLLGGPFQNLLLRFARQDATCGPILEFRARQD